MAASPEPPSTVGHSWIAGSPAPRPDSEIAAGLGLGPRPQLSEPLPPLLHAGYSGTPTNAGTGKSDYNFSPLYPETPSAAFGASPCVPLAGEVGEASAASAATGSDARSPPPGTAEQQEQAPSAGFFNVNPMPMPNLFGNKAFELPKAPRPQFSPPPPLPSVNLFGSEAVQAWLDLPGVELAIEATFLHGVDINSMPPDSRLLPLAIHLDNEGKRTAQVGRQHQTQWFESYLSPGNICCVSRTAFEIMWSDQSKAGVSVFALQTLGSGIVQVSGMQTPPGVLVPLLPGARITLGSQAAGEIIPLVTFALHFRVGSGAASSPQRPCFASAARRPEPAARPIAGAWWLMCTFAKGLLAEDLQQLLPQHAALVARHGPGAAHTVVGRQQQPEVFEALLRGAPEVGQFVSRSHLQLEPIVVDDGGCCCQRLQLTNLSTNLVLVDEVAPLPKGESASLRDGQTISFTMHQNVPFLTFRLVAPSNNEDGCSKLLALPAASQHEGLEEKPPEEVVSMRVQEPPPAQVFGEPVHEPLEDIAGLLKDCSAALLEDYGRSSDVASSSAACPTEDPVAELPGDDVEEENEQAEGAEHATNMGVAGPPPRRSPMPAKAKCGCRFLDGIVKPFRKSGGSLLGGS